MTASGNLHPNAVGDLRQFPKLWPVRDPIGSHYEYVDEDPPNDEVDGIENDTTTYYEDLYNCETFTIPEGKQVDSIIVYMRGMSGITSQTRGYAYIAVKTGGATSYGSLIRPANDWTTYSATWLTSPATGLRWTQAELDALQIGVKAKVLDIDYPVDVTAMWFVVNYSDIPLPSAVEFHGDGFTCWD